MLQGRPAEPQVGTAALALTTELGASRVRLIAALERAEPHCRSALGNAQQRADGEAGVVACLGVARSEPSRLSASRARFATSAADHAADLTTSAAGLGSPTSPAIGRRLIASAAGLTPSLSAGARRRPSRPIDPGAATRGRSSPRRVWRVIGRLGLGTGTEESAGQKRSSHAHMVGTDRGAVQ
jgi:hypothetical protein